MPNKITLLCLCAVVALSLISAACSQATPSAPTNASPTETPPVVSRDVSPSETPPVDDPVAPSFATYTNVEYGFEFDYPAQVEVRVEEKPFQLLVYAESANPFYIRATRDFLPGDATYFLDTSSTGELVCDFLSPLKAGSIPRPRPSRVRGTLYAEGQSGPVRQAHGKPASV
jgi:hypothetical protein